MTLEPLAIVRRLLETAPLGSLATSHQEPTGTVFPYASLTAFALDVDGSPLLLLSRLAAHTRNLLRDSHCSLLVASESAELLAGARITLLGVANSVSVDANARVRQCYLSRHPEATRWVDFGDFAFYQLQVLRVHFVGGFGVARWIDGERYYGQADEDA